MVIITLQGGLGNQMFQYAAGKSLAEHHACKLLLDISTLHPAALPNAIITPREYELRVFKNLDASIAKVGTMQHFLLPTKKNKLLKKLGLPYKKLYREPAFTYDAGFHLIQPPVLLKGYFQSEKYFSAISGAIRQSFSFPSLTATDINMPALLHIQNSCSVSVHIRRGDYVNDPAINAVHGTCSLDYYNRALQWMKQQLKEAIFVFFSDDPAWTMETFSPLLPGSFFVEGKSAVESWKDMYLMSKCKHHIIANSSFSWWGAWLNDRPGKKVIAPKSWFADRARNAATTDLIPESWTRL